MAGSEISTAQAVPEDLVELGRVSGAYGVRGWIKVQPHAAGSAALLKSRTWWLRRSLLPAQTGELPPPWPVKVAKSRTQGSTIVGGLEGVSDRSEAEQLRGCTVWVSRAQFPAAEDDEYYWVDLMGCTLYGEHEGNRVLLGIVDGVMDNGAHAVLRVKRQQVDEHGQVQDILDSKGHPLETLVPFVAAHVHTVDIENRRLESDWPVEY